MLDIRPALDPDPVTISIQALRARQPIGDLYLGAIKSELLVRITDFDVRRVIQEERDVERYLGIQRPLDMKRVNQLNRYVNFMDATFPTACILAVEAEYADYDEERMQLLIRNFVEGDDKPTRSIRYIARVLDGQHRIAGLRDFNGETFEVPVVFFIGADMAEQANIFSTVNLEQNKVSKSLAYDLFALAKTRSPQRLAHEMAIAFDGDEEGPFFRRIKRLGVATPGRYNETLAQSQFVEGLLRLITPDEKLDRDILLRGRMLTRPSADELNRFIFRGMFVEGRDMDIANSFFGFFQAVRERWPIAWDAFGRGYVLNKTSGFRALIRLLRLTYLDQCQLNSVLRKEQAAAVLARSELKDEMFTTEYYKPGSSGESKLFVDLRDSCGLGD